MSEGQISSGCRYRWEMALINLWLATAANVSMSPRARRLFSPSCNNTIAMEAAPNPSLCSKGSALSRPTNLRMEWASPAFGFVVVRQRVLLPFAVRGVSVESYIRMHWHSVIVQHSLVNTMPDGRRDRPRGHWIDEKRPGLEHQHHTRTKIPAAASPIRG